MSNSAVCPGVSLLDLLHLEHLEPVSRSAVLPFLHDICRPKQLLLLEDPAIWPDYLPDQDALLLLKDWSMLLCPKVGEASAVYVITQQTSSQRQLHKQ